MGRQIPNDLDHEETLTANAFTVVISTSLKAHLVCSNTIVTMLAYWLPMQVSSV